MKGTELEVEMVDKQIGTNRKVGGGGVSGLD
jgi:hypothetical protein